MAGKPKSLTFGYWLYARRRAFDLTQRELAQRVNCAEITIRKMEADQMRPSKELVRTLALELRVPYEEIEALIQLARKR